MGVKQDLEAEDAIIHQKLAIINGMPEDTYPFGTVAQFSYVNGQKDFFIKVAEESWKSVATTNLRPLSDWIYLARYAVSFVHFEVYLMFPDETPIYATQ